MSDCLIRFFNEFNDTLAFFEEYRSLQWSRKINDGGRWSVTLYGKDQRVVPEISRLPVCFIEIIVKIGNRTVPIFDGVYTETLSTEYDNGNSQIVLSGYHISELLARRSIMYPEELPQSLKTTEPHLAIAEYVEENIGIDADNSFRDKDGSMPNVLVNLLNGYLPGTPSKWSGDKSGKNLLSVLQDIAAFGEIEGDPTDFEVSFRRALTSPYAVQVGIGGTVMIDVDVYNGYQGTDRRKINTDGNVPLVFATKNDNVQRIEYWKDGEETNCITVVGSTKKLVSEECVTWNLTPRIVVDDQTRIDTNRYNQVERQESDRSTEYTEQLITLGKEWLGELQLTERIRFTPKTNVGYAPWIDYDIGDAVTVETCRGEQFHQRIFSYETVVSSVHVKTNNFTLKTLGF